MMRDILFDSGGIWVFMLITVFLGGGGAYATGRAMARNWQDWPMLIVATFGLGVAVRFIHFALFQEHLLSLHYYLVDSAVLSIIGLMGFYHTRAGQMTRQYHWLYVRTGPFSWAERAQSVEGKP
jgi:hypothetical protein